MKIKWIKDATVTKDGCGTEIPEMLIVLPENEYESSLLESLVAWRHSQDLSKKEQS